jgi:TPR repeat protein
MKRFACSFWISFLLICSKIVAFLITFFLQAGSSRYHFVEGFSSHPHHNTYLQGLAFEEAQDYSRARELYELARESTTQHPTACARLWDFYQFGRPGVARNPERAYTCVSNGALSSCVHCCGALSLHMAFGWGMHRLDLCSGVSKIDVPQAVSLAKASAQAGSPYGQYALATFYFGGIGVTQSSKDMFMLYSMAARQGLGRAKVALGACFKDGIGVDVNLSQAATCFEAASELGVEAAAVLLEDVLDQIRKQS